MRRRSVIGGLAALLLVTDESSVQQSPAKIPRIGVLGLGESERTPMFDAFREGLNDLGYIEGRNISLEFPLARGDYSLFSQLTAELVTVPVDVIVADGGVRFIAKASRQVPIVIPTVYDPVRQGVATSLARPGGNVTGFTS